MASTDFARMNSKAKVVWSRTVWSEARDKMFCKRFTGKGDNSMIQLITELTRTEGGDRVLMQLVSDLVEDGVIGDDQREGNEEQMQNFEQEIIIDLLSHQVRNKGKLSDQRTVLRFRELANSRLSYWLGNRLDQLVFLMLSGISFAYQNNGALRRPGSPFPNLSFAQGVSAPTARRHLRWDATQGLVSGDTTAVDPADKIGYAAIVDAVAYAKENYMPPLVAGGKEYYVGLVRPGTLAQLKKDPDYLRSVVGAAPRSDKHPFFTGAVVTVDGLVLHEHRLVYNTTGAAAGQKWGAAGDVNGTRTLICGAQALGMADMGSPDWVEKKFDYDSKQGISVDKMVGLHKPKFYSIHSGTVEDFSVLAIDHAA